MIVNTENQVQEIQLKYKAVNWDNLPKISGSRDVVGLLRGIWDVDQICLLEEFKIVLLSNSLHVLGVKTVNTGSLTSCLVDLPQIFRIALLSNAANIILAHNHPSGKCTPSRADFELTTKIKNAAAIFSINIADHIILTSTDHYSMAENGEL